jgi:hypothetical protein
MINALCGYTGWFHLLISMGQGQVALLIYLLEALRGLIPGFKDFPVAFLARLLANSHVLSFVVISPYIAFFFPLADFSFLDLYI